MTPSVPHEPAPERAFERGSDRATAKHDRLARFYRVIRYLQAHPEGATPDAIAGFVGMSRRTVYRDLQALEGEIGIPLWSEAGRWGIVEGAFLPPLRLTLDEAVAFFLAARLTAQFADRYDPDMGAAFQKLAEILPPVVARHLERTIDVLASRPPDERLTRHLRTAGPRLGRAAGRRAHLRRGHLQPRPAAEQVARPPLPAGGVGDDAGPVPDRLRRVARRDPNIQAAADPGPVADARHVRAARSAPGAGGPGPGLGRDRRPGGGRGGAALRPRHRRPRDRDDVASDGAGHARGRRQRALARARVGHAGDPALDPAVGRAGRGPCAAGSCATRWRPHTERRRRGTEAGEPGRAVVGLTGGYACAMELEPAAAAASEHDGPSADGQTHPQMWAVNLVSDPIHGYIELTKRLTAERARALGLAPEEAAEGDLLDSAWLQRMRRISQLQSARWVFPTAEHSRFTHGLGVMHEAGLWARHLYPSLRTALVGLEPGGGGALRRPGRGDAAARRAAPRRRPRAVRPLLRRARSVPLPRAGRPPPGRRQEPHPRGPLAADHRARAGRRDPGHPARPGRRARARRPAGG